MMKNSCEKIEHPSSSYFYFTFRERAGSLWTLARFDLKSG